ncbi:hypothetical protein BDZ91DRAFT_710500 [Kalaharituber pfeilii]|nr:hypothetical protein BDZ91DRAFT_710500 [Kalaharituber pfeilii]
MLPRRVTAQVTTLIRRATVAQPVKPAVLPRIAQRGYAKYTQSSGLETSPPDVEVLSVPRVRGVPIVSNYDTVGPLEHPDPEMTGGYVNPPPEKRQFRSPYTEYWDQQDRRNFGEAVNEDEDILSRFSPEVYTWTSPKMAAFQNGLFVLSVLGLCGIVYQFYPDKPAVPRTFPHGGLREALGGGNAPAARAEE